MATKVKAAMVTPVIDGSLVAAIQDVTGCDREEIVGNASLVADLGCDSLDIMEIVMAVEESSDLDISDEDIEKFNTVQEASDYIRGRKDGR